MEGDRAPGRGLDPGALGFDRAAADYEAARPGYPAEAIARLAAELGIHPGRRVCDLAAGTGKLTRMLVGTGAEVVAVEPVPGMRAQLAVVLPGVAVLAGTAEAIPLDDGSVDVVTVAQAFHWFDAPAAMAEIRRVLTPDGGLAVLFNERDERRPWVAALSEVIGWHRQRVSWYQGTDWGEVTGADGEAAFEWEEAMTRSKLAGRIRSISYVALMPPDLQGALVERALTVVDGMAEPFPMPYVTRMWWGHPAR
ncbi:MAG: class I SAM-dependent methyltransferase [Acidimicrobiia bacterium]